MTSYPTTSYNLAVEVRCINTSSDQYKVALVDQDTGRPVLDQPIAYDRMYAERLANRLRLLMSA